MGVNRLSFGIQDFDPPVQEEINRIQPPELVSNLLTDEIRGLFPAINFDLLIGLPKQTLSGLKNTIDEVIKLASKLLESGMLTAAAPRKAPILKSSLLLRSHL